MNDIHEQEHDHEEKHEEESVSSRVRTDFPRKEHHEEYADEVTSDGRYNTFGPSEREDHEEYAAEVAPPAVKRHEIDDVDNDEDTRDGTMGKTAGYVGLACGIVSLFMWSIILGPIAAVIGFYSYSQGNKVWGAWSMGLGIVATLSYFVMLPFAR